MGDNMSGAELTTETVELSEGMLALIGSYGMDAALDVRVRYLNAASESPLPERTLSSADPSTSEGVRPRAAR